MTTTTAIIGIGGNIDGEHMGQARFARFQTDVVHAACTAKAEIFFVGEGEGVFEGKSEPSFTVVCSIPVGNLPLLRRQLKQLTFSYQQQSIALTLGETEFVDADTRIGG